MSHDFAVISLSDCMTPWELIKKRIRAMAESDMVMCIYNPSSRRRAGYLKEACDIVMEVQPADTVCGYVRNIGRDNETPRQPTINHLPDINPHIFTTHYTPNTHTKIINGKMVTPRGYKVV